MAALKVLRAGPGASVQDSGRPGFLRAGISQGGAMDQLALEEGRILVGNEAGLAALEMAAPGGRFEVSGAGLCMALTGACFSAKVDGIAVQPSTSFTVAPGQVLEIGAASRGNYGYLSIAGGIDTKPVLGSRSTHVKAGFGGFEGRFVKGGDVLSIGSATSNHSGFTLPLPAPEPGQDSIQEIRILWAAQSELFDKDELQRFTCTSFEISPKMDRMGTQLASEADPVRVKQGLVALSGIIALGDIQIPGNGRPVVLLADRQPTGGYPRIATIIGADITKFVRCSVGTQIRFRPVSEHHAIEALADMTALINHLPDQLAKNKNTAFTSNELLSKNLISGVISSDDPSRNSR